MTIELLIQAIVRQTTVLIAQLATSGGARAPLAQVANQVFLELVNELHRQGVSRKVSADMFGLGLRTYQRKIQRVLESSTDRGRSLWEAVLEHIASQKVVTRAAIQRRFSNDDGAQVRGVLRDLCESGLIFSSGQGASTAYRASSHEELRALRQLQSAEGLDELIWAIIFHEGPLTLEVLAAHSHLEPDELRPILERLVTAGRVEQQTEQSPPTYRAGSLVVPFGAPVGWEAAVFDHFQAMVKTICCRLREDRPGAERDDVVGGSTFSFDVWEGHRFEQEVRTTLKRLREELTDLRRRVESENQAEVPPARTQQVILYVGQCMIEQEDDGSDQP